MRITIGNVTIFDGSDGSQQMFDTRGRGSRALQVVSPIRAKDVKVRPRGLRQTDITFTVSLQHESEARMLEYLFFREAEIPMEGLITIEGREPNGGPSYLYIDGCVETVEFWHQGTRTFHTYRIIGGGPTSERPRNS